MTTQNVKYHPNQITTPPQAQAFPAKERDSEIKPLGADSPNTTENKLFMRQTGLDYFGARYYSSGLSVWLSLDVLAGEYHNESPFCCAGKASISAGTQAAMNKGDVDMADVVIGAVTTPGAGALFGGLVDYNGYSDLRIVGENKSLSQAFFDITTGALGNKLGSKGYSSIKPYLRTGFERGLLNTTATLPASTMSAGINMAVSKKR